MKRAAVLAGLVLFALAGCSSPTAGQANPHMGPTSAGPVAPSSSAADQFPGPGVPKVANPIDTSQAAKDPCTALTSAQLNVVFGSSVESHPRNNGAAGPSCLWGGDAGHDYAEVSVIFTTAGKKGLTSVYASKGTSYKFFQPLEPVSGYPAVAYDVSADRTPGQCNVAVGVSDTQTLDVGVRQPKSRIGAKDPCESARSAAEMVVATVRGGQ